MRYFIDNEKERDIADGFVPKSKDWEKDAKSWADIVVFDDTLGQGARAQALRATGKPVIGGTPILTILKTIARLARRSSRRLVSRLFLIRNSILSIVPSSSSRKIPTATSSSLAGKHKT